MQRNDLTDIQPLTMKHGLPLIMPRLSMKFNEVCFGTFLSNW